MKKRLLGIAALALILASCVTINGGGWLFSAGASGKATFGFRLKCDPATNAVSGQFQYIDHGFTIGGSQVSFHGVPTTVPEGICSGTTTGLYSGTYTPQPSKLGAGGTFDVIVTDGGEPGPGTGDSITVSLTGGIFDSYFNAGALQGGNIQVP